MNYTHYLIYMILFLFQPVKNKKIEYKVIGDYYLLTRDVNTKAENIRLC